MATTNKSNNRTVLAFKGGKMVLPLANGKKIEYRLVNFILNTDPTSMGKENLPLLQAAYERFLKGTAQKIQIEFQAIEWFGYIGDFKIDADTMFKGVALNVNAPEEEESPF